MVASLHCKERAAICARGGVTVYGDEVMPDGKSQLTDVVRTSQDNLGDNLNSRPVTKEHEKGRCFAGGGHRDELVCIHLRDLQAQAH